MEQDAVLSALQSISDKLEGVRANVYDLDKRVEVHAARTELQLKSLENLDAEQNAILAEHQARSVALQRDVELRDAATQKLIQTLDARIDRTEMVLRVARYLPHVVAALASVSTGVVATIHFLSKVK